MTPTRRSLLSMLALAPTVGLAGTAAATTQAAGRMIVLVRHAEKVDDDLPDPGLSAIGLARVHALTELLAPLPLVIAELGGPAVEINEHRYVDLFLLLPQPGQQPPWFLRASYGCASG